MRDYRVEYVDRDGRWKGRDFDSLIDATEFFDSVGYADLLNRVKYVGFVFIARKG